MLKIIAVCCVMLLIADAAIMKREIMSTQEFLASLQGTVDQLRNCIDQNIASVLGQVNEKQLQPVFNVVGDSLNKVSKVFDDLTMSTVRPETAI